MIGLKKHTVKLVPHDASWHNIFEETKKELSNLIGDIVLDIQHIGSTSIKNIEAKPIIDIAISVDDLQIINKLRSILEQHGYEYRGDGGENGGHLFVKCSDPEVRTHHIHVVDNNDNQWKNFLKFRDIMNSDEKLAYEYSKFKRKLAKRFKDNRKKYTKAKKNFIDNILNDTLKEDKSNCIFCKIIEGRSPVSIVYEDDKVLVFPPLEPVNVGHMLIVPKKHAPYLANLDERTNLHIIKIARKVASAIRKSNYKCEGINWFLADGEAAHQEVFHFHFHVYPRFKGDGFGFKYDKKKNFIRMKRFELDKIARDIKNIL